MNQCFMKNILLVFTGGTICSFAETKGGKNQSCAKKAESLLEELQTYGVEVMFAQGDISDEECVNKIVKEALERLGIDNLGLNKNDKKLLEVVIKHYGGGPVGCKTLAISLGEEVDTIEDVYEPYLIQIGFLQRTPRGRVATQKAYEHLGFDIPLDFKDEEANLFSS